MARRRIHVAHSPFGENCVFGVAVRAGTDRPAWLTRVGDSPGDRDELVINWPLDPTR
jgi:hypothetical protein